MAAADPIHQFEIQNLFSLVKIGGTEIHFTNSAAFMFLAVGLTALLLLGEALERHQHAAQHFVEFALRPAAPSPQPLANRGQV